MKGPRRSALTASVRKFVHNFKRTQYLSSAIVVPAGSSFTFGAYSFVFDAMPSYTDFTALYDMYKINGLKFTLIPRHTEVPIGTTAPGGTQVMSVLDFDDDVAPGSINQLCQYANLKQTRGNINHSRYWKPRIKQNVNTVSATAGYEVTKPKWLDLASTDIKHYGIKYAIEQSGVSVVYDLRVDFYFQCKNLH